MRGATLKKEGRKGVEEDPPRPASLCSCIEGSIVVESKKREKRHSSSSTPSRSTSALASSLALASTPTSMPSSLHICNFNDLEVATDGFSLETFLGEGSRGCIYKQSLRMDKKLLELHMELLGNRSLRMGREKNQMTKGLVVTSLDRLEGTHM